MQFLTLKTVVTFNLQYQNKHGRKKTESHISHEVKKPCHLSRPAKMVLHEGKWVRPS